MEFTARVLGNTGLAVGPLGLSASYGMPAKAVEWAFERGMNYLYFGSIRRGAFAEGIRNLRRQRERMVLVVQSYTRFPFLMEWSLARALRKTGCEFADVLLLGWWNRTPADRVLEAARALRAKGLVRHLAVSSHNRLAFALMPSDIGILHVRYNAAHRGAERDVFPRLTSPEPGVVSYTATSWSQLLRYRGAERTPTAGDCYRFALSNPNVHLCMTGTANEDQTRHAVEAMARGPMDEEELAWMRRVGDAVYGTAR